MKKDEEVEKSMRETTALVKETQEVFLRTFSVYLDSIVGDLRRGVVRLRREGRDSSAVNELTAATGSMNELLATLKKSNIRRARTMKVVLHKNEAHANDRLFAALERLNRDAKAFQSEMKAMAKAAKSSKTRNEES